MGLVDQLMMLAVKKVGLSLLLISPALLSQPVFAEPCLTQETLSVFQRRMGEIPASILLAGVGLGLCNAGTNPNLELSLQRIEDLSNQAASSPEELSCPISAQIPAGQQGLNLVPDEPGFTPASRAARVCSCTRYKEALREAQAALRSLSK